MGASLSQQEQLFVDLQWQDLLENAMEADMAEQELAANGQPDQKNAQKGFRVSFNELQGFLSVLEYAPNNGTTSSTATLSAEAMSPAFSQVCDRLTADQLHSPVIVLMVHVCSWWAGAIDGAALAKRMDGLCALLATKVAKLTGQPIAVDGVPDDNNSSSSADEDEEGDAEEIQDKATHHPPQGKRARLLQSLRRRFKGRGTSGGGAHDEKAVEELQMDTVTDLIALFSELLGDTTADTSVGQRRAAQARRAVFDRLSALVKESKRPMVGVALCFLLAVFADRTPETILYAEDGVALLRQIGLIFSTARRGEASARGQSASPPPSSTRDSGTEVSCYPAEWGLVRQLESSLMAHQYELDAVQAVGPTGQTMVASMRAMEQSRRQLSRVALVDMSPTERWRYGMSQYVGQRHVWGTLRQHFLSARLFDTEKPTVMVLFGPSGYGKSEMAKRLASVLHACPVADLEASGKLVHIHMPSFCTKDSIYSLVDPPAAHVGDGILLSALIKADDAVVVLDEFEKSTADAIQNLWLSAFQKNGTLRSLKKADRCVSTVRTTFVLTCNTSAAYIDSRATRYLGANAEERQAMRDDFVRDCRQTFQQTLGDPFVNRVDFFLPFVPYTREERAQFVEMQLERLLTHQKEKGRIAYVTPRFVKVLVDELTTFHANTIEEIVRPLIVRMAEREYQTAVLTVLARASLVDRSGSGDGGQISSRPGLAGFAFVVLPARRKTLPSGETVEWSVPSEEGDGEAQSTATRPHIPLLSWADVKGGTAALALWEGAESATTAAATATTTKADDSQTTRRPEDVSDVALSVASLASGAAQATASAVAVAEVPLEVELEHELTKEAEKQLSVETEREKALTLELEKLREIIVEKDKQIVTLKEKVMMLQKALAVMMCMVLCCCFVMVMIVGLKLTLLLVGFMLFLLCVVLGVPLRLLLGAVWALFQFLGPAKSAIIIAIMAMWVYRAGASLVMQCK